MSGLDPVRSMVDASWWHSRCARAEGEPFDEDARHGAPDGYADCYGCGNEVW